MIKTDMKLFFTRIINDQTKLKKSPKLNNDKKSKIRNMSKQVSADVVHAALGNKDISIIDVRTPGEFAKGSISGSINIPVNEIGEKIGSIITDKNKTIYLYCLSGSRSETATYILEGQGYLNAFSMTNGLLMWRAKKYEVISP